MVAAVGCTAGHLRYQQERKISHEDSLDVDVTIFTQWDLAISPIVDNAKVRPFMLTLMKILSTVNSVSIEIQ